MKSNGFTLIELLAVIVILALILVIAVPQINKVITNSKRNAFESDARIVLSQLDRKGIDSTFDMTTVDVNNIESKLGVNNNNYEKVTIAEVNNEPYIVILGKNKWDGLVAYGTYKDMKIGSSDDYQTILDQIMPEFVYDETKGVNAPKLAQGMTPIKWDGTTWVETTTSDTEWYNYGTTSATRNWANATTEDGSMWVWIPRYVYKIINKWHTAGASSTDAGTIEIQFSMGLDDTKGGTLTLDTGTTASSSNALTNGDKYTNHPAFTFGSKELGGIWVAKFETSVANQTDACYTASSAANCNKTTLTPKIIPSARAWRSISIGNAFTTTRLMETNTAYGWDATATLNADGTYTTDTNNVDTHLIKNVEWGAVTYLSKSSYGKEAEEVWINPANNFMTGCAGSAANSSQTTGCTNPYSTTNGVKASTTGTIYGIYDMSGGVYEFVMGNYNNTAGSSELTPSTINGKYIAVYTGFNDTFKGDAVYETRAAAGGSIGWYQDYGSIVGSAAPWFTYGNHYQTATSAGLFCFSGSSGTTGDLTGFRPALLVGKEL